MKKILSIILSLAIAVCFMPTAAFAATASVSYSDIEGEACEGAVNVLTALGVVEGYPDNTYAPNDTVTRAEMAAIIIRALGVSDYASTTTSRFTDMSNAQWAIPYVEYAANLNIVNGYGNDLFGPNDTVTYEQAATMIVRAIGYTDDCSEMNGTYPAIYVQKATALGLFNDVTNSGSAGATRGDIAIMVYNALTVPQVYADSDGTTQSKLGADGGNVSMMDILNSDGSAEYKIISSTDVETSITNIVNYVGAAGEVVYNKDGDVIAVSDIKTTFITGEFDYNSNSSNKFEAEDGTIYTIAADAYKAFIANTTTGATESVSDVAYLINSISQNKNKAFSAEDDDMTYTIAAVVSGKTITAIYSISEWQVTKAEQVDDSDLAKINSNQKFLSVSFALDDDNEIDTNSFILNGVDSLDEIAEDNIVYVYEGNDEIKRIDVGTSVIEGTITKKSADKITIDGTSYEFSDEAEDSIDAVSAGDEVILYLDYAGDIYAIDTSVSSGKFAVLVNYTAGTDYPTESSLSSVPKVELLTSNGVIIYEVNGNDYLDNEDNIAWDSVNRYGLNSYIGKIVQYDLNSLSQIDTLTAIDVDDNYFSGEVSNTSISDSGYLNGYKIADSAIVYVSPLNDTNTKFIPYEDTDDLSVTTKSAVLGADVTLAYYVVKDSTNQIVCLLIDDSASSNDEYGIATNIYSIDGGDGVDFYLGTTYKTDGEINSKSDDVSLPENGGGLYKITSTASGEYKFKAVTAYKENGTVTKVADPVITTFTIDEIEYTVTTIETTITDSVINEVKNGYVTLSEEITTETETYITYKDGESTIAVDEGITIGDYTVGTKISVINTSANKYNLYDDIVIYVYDIDDDTYEIGTTSDLIDDNVVSFKLYMTETSDSSEDNYNLIDYAIVIID